MRAATPRSVPPVSIQPDGIPNQGVLFVNNQATGQSGHGNQALVECANGDIVSFFPRTSADSMQGHSTTGWTEYRISRDGGKTWSESSILEYSRSVRSGQEFHSALVEEAVTTPNGTLIAFVGRYTTFNWRRTTPVYLISKDCGRTWNSPQPIDGRADISRIGLTHAAFVHKDTVYVMFD